MKRKDSPAVHPDISDAAAWFREHRAEIRATYPDKFIAILDRRVVGSDEDPVKVGARARKKYPNREPYVVWAQAMSLEEMLERFHLPPEALAGDPEAWHELAVEDVVRC